MFGTRRLAKRSIVGTRVAAQWQDGRYYSGVLEGSNPTPNGRTFYTVNFDDGHTKEILDTDIIGPGFQSITDAKLKRGQKVFLTHHGRELSGVVIKHNKPEDIVIIIPDAGEDQDSVPELMRPLEEVRLLESRKSARLQDMDTDYSKMADLNLKSDPTPSITLSSETNKKRTVSQVIDVPLRTGRRRKGSPDLDDLMQTDQNEAEMMDERSAALVLTALSCSPVSPTLKGEPTAMSPRSFNDSFLSSSFKSGSPSPPMQVSESAPSFTVFGSSLDEGIVLEDSNSAYFSEEGSSKRRKPSTRTIFKCTWPGCGRFHSTCEAIEKHVREAHLGPQSSDADLSDHEEEFYYTEEEVTVDSMVDSFAQMYTSSPPDVSHFETAHRWNMDHDYLRKVKEVKPHFTEDSNTSPINIPGNLQQTLSWTSGDSPRPHQISASEPAGSYMTSAIKIVKPNSQERFHSHQAASPKSHVFGTPPRCSPTHKKSRSEVKKCRKVYGMENRDMWCTQCKWKKACTRFIE